VLFWFWGHPVVYYVPFTVFGGLYALIPQFAGRPLYSDKWARWNILLLFTFAMTAWVHHLQTWPLPVYIRAFITPTTLLLAAGSGLTVLNLGLTIATAKKYDYKNPVGFSALIALIGFILAGLQALILPLNALNALVHNTYYVVGHFHLMIWTIIVVGYVAILLDMLQTKMGTLMQLSDIGKGMIFGGLGLWTIGALGAGYTMSYAGYEGLIRRWVSYPPYFQSFMDAISYFAMIMGISFAMYVIPVLFTLLGVGTNVFWVRSEAPSMPTGTNITMNTTDNSSSSETVNTKTLNSSDKNLV
jgi:cytochrome aa3-600 menaquinol oxidase subunit 1